ncbi:hypothetical protein Hypma_003371 [Hypsizygus marmoreus]|uniref:Cohesin subunit SCC3/SA HEAT-repeats domain-containing protein n=1 Tax=Hypsizygus marmoreus TaxID=39966 RepID=A0A369J9J9_HYPMA|nr:hypothetical protein Hypma_003371 [Hypsizygus marmoreus]
MATKDTELPVRVAVIQVLGAIDGYSLLEDEKREKLCLLVFDEEAKVRKAVSQLVKGVLDECVDERLVGKNQPNEEDQRRSGIKALAMLLVKWGKSLDKIAGDAGDADGDQEDEEGERIFHRVDAVRDWEGLLDLLLLDHSAAEAEESQEGGSMKGRGRANGKTHTPDSVVEEARMLEEVEESILLEGEETVTNVITRELVKGLPRLFIKHQTDQTCIADVLLIPTLMNLDLYLEMRMIAACYPFPTDLHLSMGRYHQAIPLTFVTQCPYTRRGGYPPLYGCEQSLSNANSTKILELEDKLPSVLRDTIAGWDEIEVAPFMHFALIWLCVSTHATMAALMDEDEGGKQSGAWDIISALVERGRLGYKEEETVGCISTVI